VGILEPGEILPAGGGPARRQQQDEDCGRVDYEEDQEEADVEPSPADRHEQLGDAEPRYRGESQGAQPQEPVAGGLWGNEPLPFEVPLDLGERHPGAALDEALGFAGALARGEALKDLLLQRIEAGGGLRLLRLPDLTVLDGDEALRQKLAEQSASGFPGASAQEGDAIGFAVPRVVARRPAQLGVGRDTAIPGEPQQAGQGEPADTIGQIEPEELRPGHVEWIHGGNLLGGRNPCYHLIRPRRPQVVTAP
jgi:hypothetical protein